MLNDFSDQPHNHPTHTVDKTLDSHTASTHSSHYYKKQPPGRFGPFSALVVTFFAFLGSQVLAAILISLVLAFIYRSESEANKFLTESTYGQFLFIAVVELTALAILYFFMKGRGITLKEIGLGRGPTGKDLGFAAGIFIVYFITSTAVTQVIGNLIPAVNLEQEQKLPFEDPNTTIGLILIFFSLAILVPITEEIMVRGFLYSGLRRRIGKIVAALFASVLFGIAHLQIGSGAPPLYVAAIDTFVLSLFLIALRERTGSLWSGIFVHGIKNGLAFLALFVFNVALI